jgi:FKBP-type peptidyl-prolyl cis-trans isomerase FkpA
MKKTASLVLLATLWGTSFLTAQAEPAPAPATAATPADAGYAFGLLMGQSLTSTGITYDLDQVIVGLKESLTSGAKTRMDAEHAKQLLTSALSALQAKAAQVQIDKELTYLAGHAKTKGVTTTASGLQYEVLKQGKGAKPKASDTVKVDYVGTLVDGKEFDSSVSRGEPAVFPLDQVIPAWTEGIQLMGVGDKFRFTIPSKLAYGAEGAGGVIPPYATLVFVVDLLSIEVPAEPVPAPAQ